MSSEPKADRDDQRNSASSSKRKPPISSFADILDSPVMQLQKSIAAQQAMLKPSFAMQDLSALLKPPGLSVVQGIQRQLALQHSIQRSISSKLDIISLVLRTAQNRVLAEMQAFMRPNDITRSLLESIKRANVLPQIVSGRLLAELRSLTTARVEVASIMRPHVDAITKVREFASKDILSSVRAASAARSAVTKQLESVRHSGVFRSNLMGNLEAVQGRISAIRLDKLVELAEEVAARDSVFAEWTEDNSDRVASQIGSALAAIPESKKWGIEEQLNYLIDWTVKQDDEEMKRNLVSFLINILASVFFALGLQLASGLMCDDQGERPQMVVLHVREQLQSQSLRSDDAAELRIVCQRAIPVRRVHRRRSERIATLYAGSVVRAREKHRKWVHIEWTDFKTGTAMEGWALSKHFARVGKNVPQAVTAEKVITSKKEASTGQADSL